MVTLLYMTFPSFFLSLFYAYRSIYEGKMIVAEKCLMLFGVERRGSLLNNRDAKKGEGLNRTGLVVGLFFCVVGRGGGCVYSVGR